VMIWFQEFLSQYKSRKTVSRHPSVLAASTQLSYYRNINFLLLRQKKSVAQLLSQTFLCDHALDEHNGKGHRAMSSALNIFRDHFFPKYQGKIGVATE
jgi:hypothetical protein